MTDRVDVLTIIVDKFKRTLYMKYKDQFYWNTIEPSQRQAKYLPFSWKFATKRSVGENKTGVKPLPSGTDVARGLQWLSNSASKWGPQWLDTSNEYFARTQKTRSNKDEYSEGRFGRAWRKRLLLFVFILLAMSFSALVTNPGRKQRYYRNSSSR
ncbi:hypothetical protein Tco_0033972 [Tanacetum coccineum]